MGIEVTARILAHQYATQYGSVPSDEFVRHAANCLGGSAAVEYAADVLSGGDPGFDAGEVAAREGCPALDRAWEEFLRMTGREDARAAFDATSRETYRSLLSQFAKNRASMSAAPGL